MDIPIELFLGFIGTSIALAIFGFVRNPQIPATLVFGGLFILTIAISTDNVILGFSQVTNSTVISEVPISNTTVYHYTVETSNTNLPTYNNTGGMKARAEALSSGGGSILVGDTIQCIDLYLANVGTLASNPTAITVGVYSSTNSLSPIQLYGVKDPSTLTPTLTFYSFCVPEGSERILQSGDRIGFNYNAGNSTNYVLTRSNDVSGGGTFDGTNTLRVSSAFGSSVWGSASNDGDMTMRMYDYEIDYAVIEEFENISTQNDFEFTELPKTLFALIGTIFMLAGALMVAKN